MARRWWLAPLSLILLLACDDGADPGAATIQITPREATLFVGDTVVLTATAYDERGRVDPTGVVRWEDTSLQVTLNADLFDPAASRQGTVRGGIPGDAWVIARAPSGARDSVPVEVAGYEISVASLAVGSFNCGLTPSGIPYCWGGQLVRLHSGWGNHYFAVPRPVLESPAFDTLVIGGQYACGLTAADLAYCWGYDRDTGALGGGQIQEPTERPQAVDGELRFQSLSAGRGHTCGLTLDGEAYCWGGDPYGQLGLGTPMEDCYGWPCSTGPSPVTGGHVFRQITSGFAHTCAITNAGETYCWGLATEGQIGTDSAPDLCVEDTPCSRRPIRVEGPTFVRVEAGSEHNCGLTGNGDAYCWGSNTFGQLGDGSADPSHSAAPVAVAGGLTFTTLSAALRTCGLTQTGEAYCWGPNPSGENGTTVSEFCYYAGSAFECNRSPVGVSGGLTFADIGVFAQHACGMAYNGIPYCWGRNNNGALGIGDLTIRMSPTPLPVFGVICNRQRVGVTYSSMPCPFEQKHAIKTIASEHHFERN